MTSVHKKLCTQFTTRGRHRTKGWKSFLWPDLTWFDFEFQLQLFLTTSATAQSSKNKKRVDGRVVTESIVCFLKKIHCVVIMRCDKSLSNTATLPRFDSAALNLRPPTSDSTKHHWALFIPSTISALDTKNSAVVLGCFQEKQWARSWCRLGFTLLSVQTSNAESVYDRAPTRVPQISQNLSSLKVESYGKRDQRYALLAARQEHASTLLAIELMMRKNIDECKKYDGVYAIGVSAACTASSVSSYRTLDSAASSEGATSTPRSVLRLYTRRPRLFRGVQQFQSLMHARRSQKQYHIRCNKVEENKLAAGAWLFVLSKTPPFPGNDTKAISLCVQTTWSFPRSWNCAAKANDRLEPSRPVTSPPRLVCSSSCREFRASLKINDSSSKSNARVKVATRDKDDSHVNQEKWNGLWWRLGCIQWWPLGLQESSYFFFFLSNQKRFSSSEPTRVDRASHPLHKKRQCSYARGKWLVSPNRKALTSKFLGERINCPEYAPKPHLMQARCSQN